MVLARPCRFGPQGGPVYPLGAIIPTPSQRQEGIPRAPRADAGFRHRWCREKVRRTTRQKAKPPGFPGGLPHLSLHPVSTAPLTGRTVSLWQASAQGRYKRCSSRSSVLVFFPPPSHGNPPGRCLLPVWWALPPVFGLGTAVAVPVWPGHAPELGPRDGRGWSTPGDLPVAWPPPSTRNPHTPTQTATGLPSTRFPWLPRYSPAPSLPLSPLIRSSLSGFPRLLDRFPAATDGVRHAPIGVPAPMGSGLEDTPRCGIAARGHGRVAIPVHRVVRHLAHRVQKPCLPRLWAGSPSGCVGKGRKTLTQGELGSASFVPRFEALIRPLGQAPVWGLFGVALAAWVPL